jgi:predicted alpha/beta hydrolase family esterase
VLFIQGAREGAYEADALLVERLQQSLGDAYAVSYPAMPDEGNAPYEAWIQQFEDALATMDGPVILVGHSVGGSVVAKQMADSANTKRTAGVFLLAAPFWGDDGWHHDGYEELELPTSNAESRPTGTPIFLYH